MLGFAVILVFYTQRFLWLMGNVTTSTHLSIFSVHTLTFKYLPCLYTDILLIFLTCFSLKGIVLFSFWECLSFSANSTVAISCVFVLLLLLFVYWEAFHILGKFSSIKPSLDSMSCLLLMVISPNLHSLLPDSQTWILHETYFLLFLLLLKLYCWCFPPSGEWANS